MSDKLQKSAEPAIGFNSLLEEAFREGFKEGEEARSTVEYRRTAHFIEPDKNWKEKAEDDAWHYSDTKRESNDNHQLERQNKETTDAE